MEYYSTTAIKYRYSKLALQPSYRELSRSTSPFQIPFPIEPEYVPWKKALVPFFDNCESTFFFLRALLVFDDTPTLKGPSLSMDKNHWADRIVAHPWTSIIINASTTETEWTRTLTVDWIFVPDSLLNHTWVSKSGVNTRTASSGDTARLNAVLAAESRPASALVVDSDLDATSMTWCQRN